MEDMYDIIDMICILPHEIANRGVWPSTPRVRSLWSDVTNMTNHSMSQ